MKEFKRSISFAMACLPVALFGGFFVLRYQLELFPQEIVQQLVAQAGSKELLMAIGLIQTTVIVMLTAFFGRILAGRLGLWQSFRPACNQTWITLLLSVTAGILFSADYWTFGTAIPEIQRATEAGMTLYGVLASVFYGGIIEEVIMRLFLMSLIGFILLKLFCRKQENVPTAALIAANVLAALLFAAGHLPATAAAFGVLTPTLIVRCFLLNGGFGLLFGWLYRKYGIQYAMVGHMLCHVVSKLIWWIAL